MNYLGKSKWILIPDKKKLEQFVHFNKIGGFEELSTIKINVKIVLQPPQPPYIDREMYKMGF